MNTTFVNSRIDTDYVMKGHMVLNWIGIAISTIAHFPMLIVLFITKLFDMVSNIACQGIILMYALFYGEVFNEKIKENAYEREGRRKDGKEKI